MLELLKKLNLDSIKELLLGNKGLKISQKNKISFFDSFYNLINAGIPITNALSILLYQTKDKNTRKIITHISKEVNRGKKLEHCFLDFPKVFNTFDANMIKMGEVTGKVADSLEIIKNREEKNSDLTRKVVGALIYPMIIVSLSIIMIIGFLTFVIPKVQKMYIDAKVNLPGLTQKVINFSQFLQNHYILLLFIFIILIIGILVFRSNPLTKIYYDQYILKIPIFGGLIRGKILSVFSNTLGVLLRSGITINESLDITKASLENAFYEKRITQMGEQLKEGIQLSETMGIKGISGKKGDPHFPIELISVVKIGESTGQLPKLLLNISDKFTKDVDNVVKGLATAIEPIVIIAVGAIVGTLVLAILLPFFNMVNVI